MKITPDTHEARLVDVDKRIKDLTTYKPLIERKNNRKNTRGRHTQVIVWVKYPNVFRKTIKHMR